MRTLKNFRAGEKDFGAEVFKGCNLLRCLSALSLCSLRFGGNYWRFVHRRDAEHAELTQRVLQTFRSNRSVRVSNDRAQESPYKADQYVIHLAVARVLRLLVRSHQRVQLMSHLHKQFLEPFRLAYLRHQWRLLLVAHALVELPETQACLAGLVRHALLKS